MTLCQMWSGLTGRRPIVRLANENAATWPADCRLGGTAMGLLAWSILALVALLAAPALFALLAGDSPRAAYARLGLARGRVLVINRFDPYREMLLDTLHRAGCAAHFAEPKTALAELRKRRYHIVVSGLVLPFLSAAELLAAVKASSPTTRVVLLTGEPDGVRAAEAIRQGAFAVLDKASMGDLSRCVDQALAEARSGTATGRAPDARQG
jgi:ActR/RegA family two-component response regulator